MTIIPDALHFPGFTSVLENRISDEDVLDGMGSLLQVLAKKLMLHTSKKRSSDNKKYIDLRVVFMMVSVVWMFNRNGRLSEK